ncbi:hypothetical protein CARUB_v10005226mg [Capsella rubella]|uniref:AT-hook motif nuclear-localized protein n=1 Tax=Capsella rubella TaxID=81985 RepID=R0H0L8_9BRAS|nr:AT-hook motif nuclear-localized protein 2 [Capsella rubella]EOA16988.1 hypothetical protein CARUB_v10005226mg [Capsella rubella]
METTGEVVKTPTGSDGGVTVVRSNAPSDFHMAPRSETSNPLPTSLSHPPPPPPPQQSSFAPHPPPPATYSSVPVKKKRGRPRKYDGAAVTLSPNPISSAAPTTSHVIDFSASVKRGKVNSAPTSSAPASSFFRPKYQVDNLGDWAAPSSAGANFTPHILTVNAGEDVTQKIISFSQQRSEAICVLCANGVVSSVTLRQPDSSGGTLTYEGRFEILSLSGTFMPSSDSDGTRSRTGGMTVSLASPDGRVVGGGVAGLLVAATPIQVVVGSFLAGTNQHDQRPKQQNHNFMSSPMPIIRPLPSSLPISTWTPPLAFDPRHKPSHDINISLT